MVARACVPTDLHPYIYHFLVENGLNKTAKSFKKETGNEYNDQTDFSLVDIFNKYVNEIRDSKNKNKTIDSDVINKDIEIVEVKEKKSKKKKRKLENTESDEVISKKSKTVINLTNESHENKAAEIDITTPIANVTVEDSTEETQADKEERPNKKESYNEYIANTCDEALQIIKNYEQEFALKFSTKESTKSFGNIGLSSKAHKLYWNENLTPYMILGIKLLDCQYGIDRHKIQKAKLKEEKKKVVNKRKYNLTKETKKLGCPVILQIREIVEFPYYKVSPHATKYKLKKHSTLIKEKIKTKDPAVVYNRIFTVRIPTLDSHKRHSVGKVKIGFAKKI